MDLNTYPERLTVTCEVGKSCICTDDGGNLETMIRTEFLRIYDIRFGETFMAEIDDRGKIIPTTIRKCTSKI
jgi:hypothetical protein